VSERVGHGREASAVDRRGFLAGAAAGVAAAAVAPASVLLGAPAADVAGAAAGQQRRPLPTPAQLDWQRDELALFIHFGVNTFTDREWGDGTERPAIFAPTALDARQWARTAREVGARAMVLTAKHHDGFCLWPTATTAHSVAASPFRDGRGDVVREFVDACRAENLRVGLYLSPWDRNASVYGDSPRYNDFYAAQLTELLTQYGPIHEVWFDGANGEGPNGKKQEYDWPRVWGLVKQLQPNSVIFSDAGPDIRWIGNERGVAGETCWSTVDPSIVPVPGLSGAEVMRSLQEGDRTGTVWRPGETDVSIRPGWFYHPAEDARVRSVDNLVQLYFTSVGRNSKLLLNVPPTPEGLLHAADIAALRGMRARLDALFHTDLVPPQEPTTLRTARGWELLWDCGRSVWTDVIDLREDIRFGQQVAAFTVEVDNDGDGWGEVARGTTIGYRRLLRISAHQVRRVRVTVTDTVYAEPPQATLHLYRTPTA
jgi:alpha-L-fucosidase